MMPKTSLNSHLSYYAHSRPGTNPSEWQPLESHLSNVATLAAEFASAFGGEEWARIAGLWHDLGKYALEFQKMLYDENGIETHLETKSGKPIHSLAGGHLACKVLDPRMARVFSWLIMGHHAGLADYGAADGGARALEPKMRNPTWSDPILMDVPSEIKDQPKPAPPNVLLDGGDVSFFIRMLFSCVVDADFLDTEAFMDPERHRTRTHEYPELPDLLRRFDEHMDKICQSAPKTDVNRARADVLEQCRLTADHHQTVFALTVPTGGGKTLASLAFALRHAIRHGKRRIIYVIPYTSIIEQTAEVFRTIPGFEDAVLEHHSNISDENENTESIRRRLASENWDAPVIVTTGVQFFESIYASKTSRCRKLHNIANSVVIFDEAQCLPPGYLRPCVFAIRELQRHYGVTPVLCTATQPVLTQTEGFDFNFKEGFEAVHEIIHDPSSLSNRLQRVSVELFSKLNPVAVETIADVISTEKRPVLCIVNSKRDARTLAEALPVDRTIHLSTNMCAAHRLETLKIIRARIQDQNNALFVISTSLVEAGVDLDFPVVYRALSGLDSIAQAAGRCNREGKMPGMGRTVVFAPEKQPAYARSPASLARQYLKESDLHNVFNPETFKSYFSDRFFQLGEQSLDEGKILDLLQGNLNFSYRTASTRFNLIGDEWQVPLIVPFGKAQTHVNKILDWDARSLFRALQRYTISVPKQIMRRLIEEGHARELPDFPGTVFLYSRGLYDQRFGFIPPHDLDRYEPETLVT